MSEALVTSVVLREVPARPIVKYPGGKGKLLKQLLPLVPEFNGTYHEPFMGGGAMFFALAAVGKIQKAYLNDVSGPLMRMYEGVRSDPEQVIKYLVSCENTSDFYYAARATLNRVLRGEIMMSNQEIAAYVIYLNKTGFNGLFRVNRKGELNVAYGKYKTPKFADSGGIRAASKALQSVELSCTDFKSVVSVHAKPGDLVYFDPPYVPRSKDSDFTEYTARGFGWTDHVSLRDLTRELIDTGVEVMLSHSDVPDIRELYKDFRIVTVAANRTINVDPSKRGKVNEVVVLGD